MDANGFIEKLKANNTPTDISDLYKVSDEYKVSLGQLPAKARALFSLNVLCVLCRNLDQAPKWRDSIDNKALLALSIDCVRETRAMDKGDRVKTLACIYHIHRHAVRQTSSVPPELILKISFMPFEIEAKYLLNEYAKTYWNILVDRLSYIERLRNKIPIIKLLPKLTEDILKTIEIYDTTQFCANLIVFLIKKLHLLYTEKNPKELNQIFKEIFTKLSSKDTKIFKTVPDKVVMYIYVKLNECLYTIAENASRTNFKESPLDYIVRTCITIVGHKPDLFHCLQTFYSNTFCSLLTTQTHLSYSETVLSRLISSLETTEKMGYTKALTATYPYLNQFLRLYIEHNVNNCTKKPWKDNFNAQLQEICLKLVRILMRKLNNCEQLLKCDSCQVKSGLHDSLRLSFLVKNFITFSLSKNLHITDTLPIIYDIISEQYKILTELKDLGCVNYEKCFRKHQTDVHNTAICLNNAQYYEFSIKLFNIYLNYEIPMLEHKNISRALYNKSICELDSKLYDDALIDAFLSLVYADGLNSDRYMSLVMDIKAKELKSKADDEEEEKEDLQLFSVLDACEKAVEMKLYGNIEKFLLNLKFSELLRHEFCMYAKLWPSVTSIGGVWRSLLQLVKGKRRFTADAEATWTLYEMIVETPAVVRTITKANFNTVLSELLESFDEMNLTPDLKIVYSSLLFLKTEFELAAASQKYGWKPTDPVQNLDPDQIPANRTIPQEYNAIKTAIQAVAILAELSPDFNIVTNTKCLHNSLRIYQVFAQLLMHLSRDMEGLQLSHICCLIAECVGDKEAYVRNASTIVYHGGPGRGLEGLIKAAASACKELPAEISAVFICDAAIYYSRCGVVGVAAKLLQAAQAQVLAALEDNLEANLDLAIGRLLDAQAQICGHSGLSALSAANGAQRHYLAIGNTGTKWLERRLHSVTVRVRCARASVAACAVCRGLRVWRRARAGAAAALCSAGAGGRARLYALITDVSCFDDAQIKIDNRLKYVFGLQPSNETQPYYASKHTEKHPPFTPKQDIETMLENLVFKKSQTSPSIPCTSVPAFKLPDWFDHSEHCECYACSTPLCYILACHACGLEAAMYFRANESDIARNYFNGVIRMLSLTEIRLKSFGKRFNYEKFVVKTVVDNYWSLFREVKIEILMELSFFELMNGDYEVVDEHIIEIHEILKENVDKNEYLYNDVMNLMTCSAQLRKTVKKPIEDLEIEFDCLKLSPVKFTEPPKTPITKARSPMIATKVIVKDEELPKKRKVIKLNIDEGDEKDVWVEKSDFKVPNKRHLQLPSTAKPVLEVATPVTKTTKKLTIPNASTRSKRILVSQQSLLTTPNKPTVLLSQPSEDLSPEDTTVYSTPKDFTPDQFFTPMTTVKTYSKQSLRQNIVKNLEQEFATPLRDSRTDKDVKVSLQVPKAKASAKKTLKRATSPGKLCKEAKELPRTRRLRKPVNFSIDDDDDKR